MNATERRMAVILIADVVGYSRLIELNEAATLSAIKSLRRDVMDPLLVEHRGHLVKLLGDGALAEFSSAVDAVNFAVALQREAIRRKVGSPPESHLTLRIGINLGDVVIEDGDLLGEGVNIAARLEQLCEPGGVLISGTVYDHLQGKLELPVNFAGEQQVKNISRPVRAYNVDLHGLGQPWRLRLRQHSRRFKATTAMMVLLSVVLSAWYALVPPSKVTTKVSAAPSIAVLPFDDMSGNSDLSYFGDGVAEDIISMLSRVPELRVVSRNSSFTYKGQRIDVRKVGEELGVTYVLEGSVRKNDDRMRIVAQLVDAKTGEHVWADRFDRSGNDPWELQDEVTERIVHALVGDAGTLSRAQYRDAWGKDSTSLQEYDYYVRSHGVLIELKPESIERAMKIATEGLAKYPDSALLKIELGIAHFIRGFNGWSDNLSADYRKAGSLVREALAQSGLSPMERRLATYLSAFVNAKEGQYERALANAEAAIALSPYDIYMLAGLSQIPILVGKPKLALDWIDRAAALDESPEVAQELAFYRGWALLVDGRLEEALTALKSDQRDEFSALMRAIVLYRLGRTDEAKAEYKSALLIDPNFTQAEWREISFYKDPRITEREIADLASLGLPEK